MATNFGMGYNKSGRMDARERQLPPREAAGALRKKITESTPLARRLRLAGRALGYALKVLLKLFLVIAIACIAFAVTENNVWAALLILVIGSAYVIGGAALRALRVLGHDKTKGIMIGRSFGRFTMANGLKAVGEDRECRVDYLKESNPHVLIVGSTSSGKTTTMRALVARVAKEHSIPFLVLDWNGEN